MENNQEVINDYLRQYKNSPQSVSMRKSCLNHFFVNFGYNKSIFELTKKTINDYFIFIKNNENLALNTKKNKFKILKSFMDNTIYNYEDNFAKIPLFKPKYNWSDIGHADSHQKIYVLTPKNIEAILDYFKLQHFVKYLIFSLYAFTGARKGEIQNLRINGVDLDKRTLTSKGKKGKKVYSFDERLLPELKMYLEERTSINTETNHFFLTVNHKPINIRTFNYWLKPCLEALGLPKEISVQYFRWSINNNRKDLLETPNEICELLIGHAPSSTNERYYTGELTAEKRVRLYDENNPYFDITI